MISIENLSERRAARSKRIRVGSTDLAAVIVDLSEHRRWRAGQLLELSNEHGRKGGFDVSDEGGGQCLVDACIPAAMATEWQRLTHLYGVPGGSFEMHGDPGDTMRLLEAVVPAWMASKFEQQFAAYKAA